MRFCDALGVQPGQIIAAVGAGGKTSLLRRLAEEISAGGRCVVSTTTTAIWQPAGWLAIEADEQRLLQAVARLSGPGRVITAAAGSRLVSEPPGSPERPKLIGVAPHVPGLLLGLPGVYAVLVEADGARGRSVKAPGAHEPVIPPNCACVLTVAAADAVGRPLDEATAHRPEIIAALLGISVGAPLTTSHITALLAHARGGRQGIPAEARYVPFINKAESAESLRAARAIAAPLSCTEGVHSVLIGAAQSGEPVREVWQGGAILCR